MSVVASRAYAIRPYGDNICGQRIAIERSVRKVIQACAMLPIHPIALTTMTDSRTISIDDIASRGIVRILSCQGNSLSWGDLQSRGC